MGDREKKSESESARACTGAAPKDTQMRVFVFLRVRDLWSSRAALVYARANACARIYLTNKCVRMHAYTSGAQQDKCVCLCVWVKRE